MPTYEYVCKSCAEPLEVVQAFSDDPLTECPKCGGELRKVFGAVGIVFKGSGFYKTDSRGASSSTSPPTNVPSTSESSSTGSDSRSTSSGESSTPTPAPASPAPTPPST